MVDRPDSVDEVRDILRARRPGYQVHSIDRLGAGLDHVAYEVNGELIVRLTRQRPGAVDREARLLATVAGICALPVPEVVFTVPERGCLAYRRLPGVPLLDLPRAEWAGRAASIAATLGEFLSVLRSQPVERMAQLVDTDQWPLADWRREAEVSYRAVAEHIPAAHRRPVEAFLAAAPPPDGYDPVFSHHDLGIEHVLVDPLTWTVTGIIDWSDAAIGDPARDVGLLYRDLGPAAVDQLGTGVEASRAAFHARCGLLEDLAYGIEASRVSYVDKSRAGLAWLFDADS